MHRLGLNFVLLKAPLASCLTQMFLLSLMLDTFLEMWSVGSTERTMHCHGKDLKDPSLVSPLTWDHYLFFIIINWNLLYLYYLYWIGQLVLVFWHFFLLFVISVFSGTGIRSKNSCIFKIDSTVFLWITSSWDMYFENTNKFMQKHMYCFVGNMIL